MILAGLNIITGLLFLWFGLMILNNRRELQEVSAEVSRLHKDFMAEIYAKYGEDLSGKE